MSTPPWRPPSGSSPDARRARDDRPGAAPVDVRAPHPSAAAADTPGARLPGGDLALHPALLPVRPGVLPVRHGRPAGPGSGLGLPANHQPDPALQPLYPGSPMPGTRSRHVEDPALQPLHPGRSGPGPRARHVEESTPTEAPEPLGPTLVPDSRPEPTPRMNDMRIRAAGRPGR